MAGRDLSSELFGADAPSSGGRDLSSELGLAPTKKETYNPTEGQSFFQNALQGVGSGMTDMALGAKQRFGEAMGAFDRNMPGQDLRAKIGAALGTGSPSDWQANAQREVDAKRAIDAPLNATIGGKVGSITAKAIPAVAAAMIPGGQTLAGSIIAGGALGGLEPTATGESVGNNVLLGGVGGAAGYGVGKGVGYVADKVATNATARGTANSLIDANTAAAREAGYVIPPSQSNPSSMIANTVDIIAGGRPKMAQAASLKNQPTTNRLAAKAVGLPEGEPITLGALDQARKEAFNTGYAPIANAGTITPNAAYTQALDSIVANTKGASNSFPGAVKNEIPDLIDGLRVTQFDAGDALKMTQVLRDQAGKAYASGDSALGKANKSAANAIEDAIDSHLSASGATDALAGFRDARKLIAKTFTVGKALNETTGDVSASVMAAQLKAGKPLSDELLQIAKMGRLSPQNVKTGLYSTPGASQLETMSSAGAALGTGNPLLLAIPYVRGGLREALLSKPMQSMMRAPSYNGSGLLNLAGSDPVRALLPASGALGLLNFGQ